MTEGIAPQDESIRDSLKRTSQEAQAAWRDYLIADNGADRDNAEQRRRVARGSIQGMLIALVNEFMAVTVADYKIDAVTNQIVAMDAEREIALAGVRLEEREVVIRRGLEGAVTFYRNGISGDDIANIIQVGQTAGIIAISTKVD